MAVFQTSDFEVYVEDVSTSPTTWVAVHEMDNFQRQTQRDSQSRSVFMNPVAHNQPGGRVRSSTLSGLLSTDDDGQAILFAAEQDDDTIRLRVLWDGTNGFEEDFKVGSNSQGAAAGPNWIEGSFELLSQGGSAVIGAGPLP
jgi:hypothetical protein